MVVRARGLLRRRRGRYADRPSPGGCRGDAAAGTWIVRARGAIAATSPPVRGSSEGYRGGAATGTRIVSRAIAGRRFRRGALPCRGCRRRPPSSPRGVGRRRGGARRPQWRGDALRQRVVRGDGEAARRPDGLRPRVRARSRLSRQAVARAPRPRARLRRVDACGQRFLHCSAPRLPLAPGSLPPVSPVVVAVARAAAARVIRAAARAQARRKPPKVGEPLGQLTWRGATTQRHVVPIANYAHVAGEAEARGAAADGQQPPRPTTASARRDAAADASHRRARPLAGVAENGSRRRPRRGAVASTPRGAGRAGDGTTRARGGSDVSLRR